MKTNKEKLEWLGFWLCYTNLNYMRLMQSLMLTYLRNKWHFKFFDLIKTDNIK